MICVTINNPLKGTTVLVIVIEKNNLERMKLADPITIESPSLVPNSVMSRIMFPRNLSLLIAYEEEEAKLHQLAEQHKLPELLRWLERGRMFQEGVDGIVITIPEPGEKDAEGKEQ